MYYDMSIVAIVGVGGDATFPSNKVVHILVGFVSRCFHVLVHASIGLAYRTSLGPRSLDRQPPKPPYSIDAPPTSE